MFIFSFIQYYFILFHVQKVKKEDPAEKWKWWEEADQGKDSGVKWKFLEHKGPVFAPPYEPLPHNIHFKYDGKMMFRKLFSTFSLHQD